MITVYILSELHSNLLFNLLFQTDEWRLSDVNKDFNVCPSYPPLVAVPKHIEDDILKKVATFRHGGRFPVLSYYHKKNGMASAQKSLSVHQYLCSLSRQYHRDIVLKRLPPFR